MDCLGVAGDTAYNPFRSFDGELSIICVLVNNVCAVGDLSA